jgi:anthranilate phosphoribosyltransferase
VGIQIRALQRLGAEHALVVYGKDGMDEVSLGATTLVGELKDGVITEYDIHPEDFGMAMTSSRVLRVDTPEASKALVLDVLAGNGLKANTDLACRAATDIVVLNAGAALYAANVVADVGTGIARAREAINSGAAMRKLHAFVQFTQQT